MHTLIYIWHERYIYDRNDEVKPVRRKCVCSLVSPSAPTFYSGLRRTHFWFIEAAKLNFFCFFALQIKEFRRTPRLFLPDMLKNNGAFSEQTSPPSGLHAAGLQADARASASHVIIFAPRNVHLAPQKSSFCPQKWPLADEKQCRKSEDNTENQKSTMEIGKSSRKAREGQITIWANTHRKGYAA